MKNHAKISRNRKAAAVVEYAILIFLVGLLSIAGIYFTGKTIENDFENVISELDNTQTDSQTGPIEIIPIDFIAPSFDDETTGGPYQSCQDAYDKGNNQSGFYTLINDWDETYPVPCNMINDGDLKGGWMPIMWRKVDDTVNVNGSLSIYTVTTEDYKQPYAMDSLMYPRDMKQMAFGKSADITKGGQILDAVEGYIYNPWMGLVLDDIYMRETATSIIDPRRSYYVWNQYDRCYENGDPNHALYWDCSEIDATIMDFSIDIIDGGTTPISSLWELKSKRAYNSATGDWDLYEGHPQWYNNIPTVDVPQWYSEGWTIWYR